MKLSHHELQKTEDGSLTLFSKEFNETCHSLSGAKTETILHYINGCELPLKFQKMKDVFILEIGFGSGLGLDCTFESWVHSHQKSLFEFVSFEKDHELIEYYLAKNAINYTKENLSQNFELYRFDKMGNKVLIISGDARKSLPLFHARFPTWKAHAVFQDAFSPKRNAFLWTKEWFSDLIKLTDETVVLSTYSASSSIRKSLIAAGFCIKAGDRFGKKRTSTRAYRQGESDPEILEHLEKSPAPLLTDEIAPTYILENNR